MECLGASLQNTEYRNQESGELRFMILDSITSFISKFIALVSKKSPFTKGGRGIG